MKRRIALSTIVLLILFFYASGCTPKEKVSSASSPESTEASFSAKTTDSTELPERNSFEVTIDPEVKLEGETLSVTADTNLIDGSVVICEIGYAPSTDEWYASKTKKLVVKQGKLSLKADVSSIPGDKVYAYLVFGPEGQPKEVSAYYGDTGENIADGEHVRMSGDYRLVEYWKYVVL